MDTTIKRQSNTYPVIILPGALNERAEDSGRALVEMVFSARIKKRTAVSVFVVEGNGLVDLRETIAELMHGRSFSVGHPWNSLTLSPSPLFAEQPNLNVIGEGVASSPGSTLPLFVEVDACSWASILSEQNSSLDRLGILVRCQNTETLLTCASQHVRSGTCYLHIHEEDSALANLLGTLLNRLGVSLTVASDPPPVSWLTKT